MEHLNPANKVLAAKKPKQTQNKQQQHPHRQQHQKHLKQQNGTAHHLATSIQRPGGSSSTPSPLNEGAAYSLPNGPLPQFHFVLVLLAFSIIGLTILCGIGCCLRALFIQRKNRRKRSEKEAEEQAERGERERLVRINQFIVRRPSGGEQQEGGLDNLGADNLTPKGTGKGVLPQIKVTTEEATISGSKKMEEMGKRDGPNEGELAQNIVRKNSRQPNG